jgi:hypothetical protein
MTLRRSGILALWAALGGLAGGETWAQTLTASPAAWEAHRSLTVTPASGQNYISSRDITITCLGCHADEAREVFHTVHYQWTGPAGKPLGSVTNLPQGTYAGKNQGSLNSYCGSIHTSPWFTCTGCHVGNGEPPSSQLTNAQLENIDCLMCHQDNYVRLGRSVGEPPYIAWNAVGQDGQPRQIQIPDPNKPFQFVPNLEAMGGESGLQAAVRSVHPTTRKTCLRCHAGAAGSDGGKRGDISSVTINPPLVSDIHMSPQGQNMVCADCHEAGGHRVSGRGIDLRPSDKGANGVPVPRTTCDSACHSSRPHGDFSLSGNSRDLHAGRVACQTCHISRFAKDISTEMSRDWTVPHWSAAACNGRGGWIPSEVRQQNVVPTYRWFDGTSQIYQLGLVFQPNASGEIEMAVPNGGVNSSGAKLYPLKVHRSIAARLTSGPDAGELIPHSTFNYFTQAGGLPSPQGWIQAIQEGMTLAELTGTFEYNRKVLEYQSINHGVEPKANALQCSACHAGFTTGGPKRMDLKTLGYGLKAEARQVCSQCHSYKRSEGFLKTHDEHVREERIDCSLCHSFGRPELGLSTTIRRGG